MAAVDDTAHAHPRVHHRAKSHVPTDTPVHESTLSDVNLGAQAIVRVIAQGVAARDLHYTEPKTLLRHPWWLDRSTIEGLSIAMSILDERSDALRRQRMEGLGA
jgi:hypothetical protein